VHTHTSFRRTWLLHLGAEKEGGKQAFFSIAAKLRPPVFMIEP